MHDEQTPEELAAHFAPGGPARVVDDWIRAVFLAGDMAAAWRLMDPIFRLVVAQAWLWANRTDLSVREASLEETASALSEVDSTHPLWPSFAATELDEFRELELDFESWGFASRPRPVAPDYELVYLVRTGSTETVIIAEPTPVRIHPFLVHHAAGRWWMAGFGPAPMEPGWPPGRPPEWTPDWVPPD